jgi:hypothetical protein
MAPAQGGGKAAANVLAQRIRAYAEKHPRDTDNIIAQALKCSAAEVHAALADAASPI